MTASFSPDIRKQLAALQPGLPKDKSPTPQAQQQKALDALKAAEDVGASKKAEEKLAAATLRAYLHRDATPAELLGLEQTVQKHSASRVAKQLSARPEAAALAQVDGASKALLGQNHPDPALYDQARQLSQQGQTPAQIRSAVEDTIKASADYRRLHMSDAVTAAYQKDLNRAPTLDETLAGVQQLKPLIDQGKTGADTDAALHDTLSATSEYRKLHAADNVNAVYAFVMGRAPNPTELQQGDDLVGKLIDEGKSNADVNQVLGYLCTLTPEWQAKHPQMNTDRDAIYMQQPNGWTCGPTSLAMAMVAAGKRPANQDTIWEMAAPDKLNTIANHSTDKMPDQIADIARSMGVNAEGHIDGHASDIRAALAAGHGTVVNGTNGGGGGHFIYLAGLDQNGQFIVCDPWHPEITRWNDADLENFTRNGPGPGNFVEIWP
jgi:hypothetical protein